MAEPITTKEAARRLGASEAFVQRMIDKGRLSPDAQGRLDPDAVKALADLLERLREGGVATVIGAIGEELESGQPD